MCSSWEQIASIILLYRHCKQGSGQLGKRKLAVPHLLCNTSLEGGTNKAWLG